MAVTKYIYDGDNVLHETDGAGAVLRTYTHDPGGYGDLLSVFDGSAARYFEPDALGSTDALADQSQTVTDRWRYRAFGSATQTAGTDTTPFTWVGRLGYHADTETGLYQLGNGTRYYDPQTAQFLSRDPIGFGGGDPNLYRYVANSPIDRLDWGGMFAIASIGAIPWGPIVSEVQLQLMRKWLLALRVAGLVGFGQTFCGRLSADLFAGLNDCKTIVAYMKTLSKRLDHPKVQIREFAAEQLKEFVMAMARLYDQTRGALPVVTRQAISCVLEELESLIRNTPSKDKELLTRLQDLWFKFIGEVGGTFRRPW